MPWCLDLIMGAPDASGADKGVTRPNPDVADVPKQRPPPSTGRQHHQQQQQLPSTDAISIDPATSKPLGNRTDLPVQVLSPEILELDILSSWTAAEKSLWSHYITTASMVASHIQLRDQICLQILPMVMHLPSLLYGTLALSALHRSAMINTVSNQYRPDDTISDLMTKSLRHLRQEIQSHTFHQRLILLHTIRTLCVCEIYSGKADSTWRIHLQGARAILHSTRSTPHVGRSSEPHWLTLRWYNSMEALTALTHRGPALETEAQIQRFTKNNRFDDPDDHSLDIYTGYSTDLNNVFKNIGLLSAQRQALLKSGRNNFDIEAHIDLDSQADHLESIVQAMICRDGKDGLRLPANLTLHKDELKQFIACNLAYQHSALLHIYRRLQNKPTDSVDVQSSVHKILEAVTRVLPMQPLSPWALLTTPLFSAGYDALGQDRVLIRRLLCDLYATLRIRNILRAIDILDRHWEMPPLPTYKDFDSNVMDFIPY
ncbi:hypothetical protein B0A52_06774 [Exophiala mesophila]|uniref:Transcription factor domain-containing protein n=1 Tax=Exophiala mesophila TaxID=212818 RepID=A0A438N038_EXOME|nr:hypothetical protein B0A52_06774 [Exophiala mesophila]